MEHSEFYELFRRFFWLIFPIMGVGFGMLHVWLRHKRAGHVLEMLKSYVDQGKEPPPELTRLLGSSDECMGRNRTRRGHFWIPTFLFAGLTAGFVMMGIHNGSDGMPFYFVAFVMGGLCLGMLVAALSQQRDRNTDRTPPQ